MVLDAKERKWEDMLNKDISIEQFRICFLDVYQVTNVPRYRSFQYRHMAIITDVHLARWKVLDSNKCTFYGEAPESYRHLFIYCQYVERLWIQLEEFMTRFTKEQINFQEDTVFMNRLTPRVGDIKKFPVLSLQTIHIYIYIERTVLRRNQNFLS